MRFCLAFAGLFQQYLCNCWVDMSYKKGNIFLGVNGKYQITEKNKGEYIIEGCTVKNNYDYNN